jgi:CheY-like chemotaxis protein
MQALGTLAGGIAHDFNNLLTAIGANTDLALIDPHVTPSVKECLTEVHNAHARARDLVKRIVLFSRRQDSQREPVVLTTVVDEATRLLRASLPPMIDITFRAAPNLPYVLADASQMHQLIMNLGTNAGQAMPDGGQLTIALDTVTIAYGATSPSTELRPGPHVYVSVTDTGTGISPDIRHRLFEPFFTTKGVAGTGLGLSVVHGIVTDHGGAITVESEAGRGTTFRAYFPVAESSGGQRAQTAAGIVPGQGEHIMYVDDEEAVVVVMTRLLKQLGYRCTGYSDANAALHAFRSNAGDIDAVVTDMAMPRMTGIALAAALRHVRPDVRIALVSGYEGPELDIDERAGFTMTIGKPVGIEALSQAMRSLVQQAPMPIL